jgi:hypothetical protein
MAYLRSLILRTRVTSGEAREKASRKRVMGVILLTHGLHQEPYFEKLGDLWRGQRSGKAVGE